MLSTNRGPSGSVPLPPEGGNANKREGDGRRAVKVVRRPELTFWEKTYLPQIFCGLKITFRHFFRNLFVHIAHRVGRLKHVRAAVTYQYPEELRPLMSRHRSRHRLTVREDGTPRCVGCMLCETVCPAKCITIVPGEHNRIKVLKRMAYGFRDDTNFFLKIRQASPENAG